MCAYTKTSLEFRCYDTGRLKFLFDKTCKTCHLCRTLISNWDWRNCLNIKNKLIHDIKNTVTRDSTYLPVHLPRVDWLKNRTPDPAPQNCCCSKSPPTQRRSQSPQCLVSRTKIIFPLIQLIAQNNMYNIYILHHIDSYFPIHCAIIENMYICKIVYYIYGLNNCNAQN